MILETPRLILRRLRMDDLPALHRLYRDPEIRRYFPDGIRTLEQTREELEWFLDGHPRDRRLGLKRVRELSGGRMEWTDGMLYPVLHRLERLGHIEARWEVAESGRRRKYYRITRRGRAQLAEERRQWQAVDSTLRNLWKALSVPVPASPPTSHQALAAPLPRET